MCMGNPVRIETKHVPEFAYKLYRPSDLGTGLITPYFSQYHQFDKFNKPQGIKKSHCCISFINSALHMGRISVFDNLKDAIKHRDNMQSRNIECWKVQIKQTTKYAYKGFIGTVRNKKQTFAVDQVKPIKRMA